MHAVKLAIHLKWQQQLAAQLPFPKILLKEKSSVVTKVEYIMLLNLALLFFPAIWSF